MDEEELSNSKSSVPGCCLTFTLFFAKFNLLFFVKVLLIKKACIAWLCHVANEILIQWSKQNSLSFQLKSKSRRDISNNSQYINMLTSRHK